MRRDKIKIKLKNLIANHRNFRKYKKRLKQASVYIKNNAIKTKTIDKLTYPDYIVRNNLRFQIKESSTKLSQDYFQVLKQRKKKTFRFRNKRNKYNFYQRQFKNESYVKDFYSLNNKKLKKYKKLQNYWPRPTHSKNLFFKNTERRLDVILVRIGYAKNIQHARDLIKYGVIFVDNVKITNKNYLVLSTSVVETKYYNSPFLLLYRYHLEHFPTKTKQEWFWRKRYKKKNKCRINREANNHILDGLNLPYSPPSFKLRLKRRLNYHKNAYKYNLKRKVIQFPLTKLPYQYIKVGINKTLITHFCKNHDIRIPTSIFKGANT